MASYNIAVLLKQVPDLRSVTGPVVNDDGTLRRADLDNICNPYDMKALEMALSIKDRHSGSRITILSMGPESAVDVIRQGLFRGADNGILLSDPLFAGSDTLATSNILAAALKKLSPDLIITGYKTLDGATAQVGPQIAEFLGIPDISPVMHVDSFSGNELSVVRNIRDEGNTLVQKINLKLPALLVCSPIEMDCCPQNARCRLMYRFAGDGGQHDPIRRWSYKDICRFADRKIVGRNGSATKIARIHRISQPESKETVRMGLTDENIDRIVSDILRYR